ncbi:Phosphate transporter [Tumidithrix helvetica PCC 7403]|uniref:inorganic phosphate transporter n=1 Tax=Tumidithrix helvetica TaxID=3457545 RepID=UPI003CC31251
MSFALFFLILLAVYLAAMLGANDVANSMGTSVGSGTLSLRKAIALAGIAEFTGASLFGHRVTNAIATGVVSPEVFRADPNQLLLGMGTVMLACAIWLNFANWKGLPVASSHAIIGALVGFGCIAQGIQAIYWHQIGILSLAWLITPLVSGTISFLLLTFMHTWISSSTLSEWIPWLSVGTLGLMGLSVNHIDRGLGDRFAMPIVGFGLGAIAVSGLTLRLWHKSKEGMTPVFGQLQILSAGSVAFAHGSNDVGNAIAPLAVAVAIVTNGTALQSQELTIPLWLLVLGGMGIVLGLSIFGRKVIATVGSEITAIEPQSGFAAELSTAVTVLLASSLSLSVSSTHALVGAVLGVGLAKRLNTGTNAIDWGVMKKVVMAWLITIPAAAILAAGLFKLLSMLTE